MKTIAKFLQRFGEASPGLFSAFYHGYAACLPGPTQVEDHIVPEDPMGRANTGVSDTAHIETQANDASFHRAD